MTKLSLPDLQRFNDQNAHQIITRLFKEGYKPVDTTPGCRIFRDAAHAHLLTLCPIPSLGEAFTQACMTAPLNPHLPRVLAHKTLDSGLHLRVTENLNSCDDFPAQMRKTISGQARAFSSLFEGDDLHVSVHPLLRQYAPLVEAVRRVVTCGGTLCDGSRKDALPVRIDPRGQSVLFRVGSHEPVFVNPLIPAARSLKAANENLQQVEARFSDAEMAKDVSRYWPKIPARAARTAAP